MAVGARALAVVIPVKAESAFIMVSYSWTSDRDVGCGLIFDCGRFVIESCLTVCG